MPYSVPTSGCTFTPFPIDATHAPERAFTGARVMSAFHGLPAGNKVHVGLVRTGAAVVDDGFGAGVVDEGAVVVEVVVTVVFVVVVLDLLVTTVSGFRTPT